MIRPLNAFFQFIIFGLAISALVSCSHHDGSLVSAISGSVSPESGGPVGPGAAGDAEGIGGGDPFELALATAQTQLGALLTQISKSGYDASMLCQTSKSQNIDVTLAAELANLSQDQISFCQNFIQTETSSYQSWAGANPQTTFSISDSPLSVTGIGGVPLSVVAMTGFGPTGSITVNRADGENLTTAQLVALIGHEFGHKVSFQGSYITDNDPIGPFTAPGGGRTFLNAVGAAIATFASPALLAFSGTNSFGTIPPGTTQNQTFNLTNNGGIAASGISIVLGNAGGAFSIPNSTCGSTLNPGASCTITVAFQPANAGNYFSAILSAEYNNGAIEDPSRITSTEVTGSAVNPNASPSPSPSSPLGSPGRISIFDGADVFPTCELSVLQITTQSVTLQMTFSGDATQASIDGIPQTLSSSGTVTFQESLSATGDTLTSTGIITGPAGSSACSTTYSFGQGSPAPTPSQSPTAPSFEQALATAQTQLGALLTQISNSPNSPMLCQTWSGQNADATLAAELANLSSEQISFCQNFIQTELSGYQSWAGTNPQTTFSISDNPLSVIGIGGTPLSVVAMTPFGSTGAITVNQADGENLTPAQLVALVGHEFGHKVSLQGTNITYQGNYITDNDPIGPFTGPGGGRTFLNVVGAAITPSFLRARRFSPFQGRTVFGSIPGRNDPNSIFHPFQQRRNSGKQSFPYPHGRCFFHFPFDLWERLESRNELHHQCGVPVGQHRELYRQPRGRLFK